MHRGSRSSFLQFLALILLVAAGAVAQQPAAKPDSPAAPPPDPPKKPEIVSNAARLASAKTAYLKKTGNTDIPFNVISDSIEGWGRYTLVATPEKADIVVEIEGQDSNDTVVSGGPKASRETGRMEDGYSTTHRLAAIEVKLSVYDSKSKVPLFTAIRAPEIGAQEERPREQYGGGFRAADDQIPRLCGTAAQVVKVFLRRSAPKPGAARRPTA